MPILVTHAEWDVDLPFEYAAGAWVNYTASPLKRWVEMSKGTHTIIMERERMQLFRAVQDFMDMPYPATTEPDTYDFVRMATCPPIPAVESNAVALMASLCVMLLALVM